MNITLLGATGFVGTEVLREALRRGYTVKVLVRSAEKLGEFKDRVEIIEGNYFNNDDLADAIEGADAVISTVRPPVDRKSHLTAWHFGDAIESVIAAMKKAKVRRFINLTSMSTSYEGEYLSYGRKALRAVLSLVAPLVIPAKEAELAALRASNIDWTSVRPPLVKEGVKGIIAASEVRTRGMMVDVTQLAAFMLDSINETRWVKKAPFVGTK